MFNPQARWDRVLPQGDDSPEILNESIKVNCLFERGKIIPRYFIWKNKLYKVKKLNFFWQHKQGRETISSFSLETNSGTYQLSLSNINLSWKLDKIISS